MLFLRRKAIFVAAKAVMKKPPGAMSSEALPAA